jgi:ABC-type lipoprotein release transport system permease subunit
VIKVYKLATHEGLDPNVVGVFETHDALTDGEIYGDVQSARDLTGLDQDKVTAVNVQVDDPHNAYTVARASGDQLRARRRRSRPRYLAGRSPT